jgi:hypothetical protein
MDEEELIAIEKREQIESVLTDNREHLLKLIQHAREDLDHLSDWAHRSVYTSPSPEDPTEFVKLAFEEISEWVKLWMQCHKPATSDAAKSASVELTVPATALRKPN